MYTLDTNAIIYYLKDDPYAVAFLGDVIESESTLYASAVTEIELFGYAGITINEMLKIEEILKTMTVISVDSRLARVAGALRSEYGLKTADSAIAATALATGTLLVTRNVKDFKRVANLKIQKI